ERGVVAAASYEARVFGVRSAMPSALALKKCPHIIFVKPRFEAYKKVSSQIHSIFEEYTDLIEPLSLDEAYLDVTNNKKDMPSATLIAKEIKKKIREKTQLTASAGISYNKFLAKIASDFDKPDGLTLISPEEAEKFVEELPIDKFFGIGKVTAERMHEIGIHTGRDLKKYDKIQLYKLFGKSGGYYYNIARAIDERAVNPHRVRKSIGVEHTFEHDLTNPNAMYQALEKIGESLFRRIEKANARGKTLTLKIKFSNFEQITRSKTEKRPIDQLGKIKVLAQKLLEEAEVQNTAIRLLGLSVSNLSEEKKLWGHQLELNFPSFKR
ncbi:DNA polymerase IV, partial [Xanthovirga aplysinae]|uniref:DNA polymerase IV n=1 Tax=Xanthovirga aplysinae TaxID=2529853 RepID=UPI0012BCAEFD